MPFVSVGERVRELLGGTWGRRPEPRVRFGVSSLPGLAMLGPDLAMEAVAILDRAQEVRGGSVPHLDEPAHDRLDDLHGLGIAAAVDEAERDAWYRVATSLFRDWRSTAQPGVDAGEGLDALGARLCNLVLMHSFFGAELRADGGIRRELLETIEAEATVLMALVEQEGASGVGLITAGHALFLAGRLFDGLEARAWYERGTGLLWGQLREQILEDGGHCDRTPPVHAAILARYLHAFALLRAGDDEVPVWGRKRVKGMADLLLRLRHPDGALVDFHGPVALTVPAAGELLTIAAILLDEPAFARVGDRAGLFARLWLGESALGIPTGGAPGPIETRALRRTRYYILAGAPGDAMFIDGDVAGPGGRANTLGYELSVGGERLIVTGDAPLHGGEAWAEYARGPRSHNVLAVSGVRASASAPGEQVSNTHWTIRHNLVCFSGTRSGLAGGMGGIEHRRRIVALPGRFWIVCDEVLGSGLCAAESYIHLHPDAGMTAVCRGRPGFIAARSPRSWAQVTLAAGAQLGLVAGCEDPVPQGWAMPPGEGLRAAPTLVVEAAGRLPLLLGYAIVPRTDLPTQLDLAYEEVELRIRLTIGTERFEIGVLDDNVELRRTST